MSILKELAERLGIDTSTTVGAFASKEELQEDPEALRKAKAVAEERYGLTEWTRKKLDELGVIAEGELKE